jgi:hypothetical protein
MMIRRTVLVATIITGATGAGAWAFGADLSRVTLALAERGRWSARGFTPLPRNAGHPDGSLLSAPNDSLAGKYCRFPPSGKAKEPNAATLAATGGDSLGVLPAVVGRSIIPQPLQAAICTGEPADATFRTQIKP